ncbi:Acg family FMN-binding oxidoreductase [Ovoidimarina sediminis]|uniref:Acg family FMN-binding oxidoreductase n=1 Tax=Ovoidimarina sediminis TaxID=3079856 RepID=UPI002913E4BE|nr:hypothetical protein [Rhodophyticola sp. MJ-SS7]MDU8945566.1 hypothetical protein [Rhodophyticola sp. MJ-SS7]
MTEDGLFEALIGHAVLAPSSHNTQPWIFAPRPDGIALYADRTRALPVNDPDDRELLISCGCALFNLRVAAADRGFQASVNVLPEADDEDLLALVELTPGEDAALRTWAGAIGLRRTCHGSFKADRPDDRQIASLAAAAEAEGAWAEFLDDPKRRRAAATLVAEGDAAQWANPHWRRELAQWMHPRRQGDGLALPGVLAPVARTVVRAIDMGDRIATKDAALAETAPVLAVIGTGADGPRDRIAAGQAMQRVLLIAAASGLQARYLNQPVQVAYLRPRLSDLCDRGGVPQSLMCLGYPEAPSDPTPRRNLDAVIER